MNHHHAAQSLTVTYLSHPKNQTGQDLYEEDKMNSITNQQRL